MAKATNFRLSEDDQEVLRALMSDWRMSGRAVVSELLRRHDPRGGVHVEPDPEFEPRKRLMTASPVSTPEGTITVHEPAPAMQASTGGMKRVTEIPEPAWKKDAPVARGETRTLTGRAHGSVPKGGKK